MWRSAFDWHNYKQPDLEVKWIGTVIWKDFFTQGNKTLADASRMKRLNGVNLGSMGKIEVTAFVLEGCCEKVMQTGSCIRMFVLHPPTWNFAWGWTSGFTLSALLESLHLLELNIEWCIWGCCQENLPNLNNCTCSSQFMWGYVPGKSLEYQKGVN